MEADKERTGLRTSQEPRQLCIYFVQFRESWSGRRSLIIKETAPEVMPRPVVTKTVLAFPAVLHCHGMAIGRNSIGPQIRPWWSVMRMGRRIYTGMSSDRPRSQPGPVSVDLDIALLGY